MERNRNTKAKSFGAAKKGTCKISQKKTVNFSGREPVNNQRMISDSLNALVPQPGIHIPRVITLVKRQVTRRFVQSIAVTNASFSLGNGHDQFLVVVAVTGNAVCYVDMWRIKRIRCYVVNDAATGKSASVTLTPAGQDTADNFINDPQTTYQVTSDSDSVPSIMDISFKKTQPCGSWHKTSNVNFAGTLFVMNSDAATGLVMDIDFEYILNSVGLPNGYAIVTATTNLGTLGARSWGSGMGPVGVNQLG